MKQYDYLTIIQSINELRFEVRNWQETQKSTSWRWSCDVCGDSNRDLRKARFGVTRKGNDFVCNCFNCGYATNFVSYLRAFHPDKYEKVAFESVKQDRNRFELDDIVSKVSDNVLSHLFFIDKFEEKNRWIEQLKTKKILVNKNNLKKLITVHNEYWRKHGNH